MAQAWWVTTHEVVSPKYDAPGPALLLQRGTYHFHDGRPSEPGYRFVWRVNGRLQARPARIDSLSDMEQLIALARAKWLDES